MLLKENNPFCEPLITYFIYDSHTICIISLLFINMFYSLTSFKFTVGKTSYVKKKEKLKQSFKVSQFDNFSSLENVVNIWPIQKYYITKDIFFKKWA